MLFLYFCKITFLLDLMTFNLNLLCILSIILKHILYYFRFIYIIRFIYLESIALFGIRAHYIQHLLCCIHL